MRRPNGRSSTDPATLTGQWFLADRGYPSVAYFEAVVAHGGSFIVRLTRSYDPWVRAAWVEGQRSLMSTPIRLSRFLAQHAGQRVDLDVQFQCRRRLVSFRVVVLPGRETAMTRLCTNLPRTPFSVDLVADSIGSAGRSNSASRSGSRTRTCISSTRRTCTWPKA